MSDLFILLKKYIAMLILSSLFGYLWFYLLPNLEGIEEIKVQMILPSVPSYVQMLIKLVLIVFLVIDFKKEELKYLWLVILATLAYPLLGVVIFALLVLEKKQEELNA